MFNANKLYKRLTHINHLCQLIRIRNRPVQHHHTIIKINHCPERNAILGYVSLAQ